MSVRLFEKLPENRRFGAIALGINQRSTKSGKNFWYLDCLLYDEYSKYYGIRSVILVNYREDIELEENEEDNKMIITTGKNKNNGYPHTSIEEIDSNIDQPFGINKTEEEINDIFIYQNKIKNKSTNIDSSESYENYKNYEKESFEELTDGQFGDYDDFEGDFNDIMGSLGYD